MDILAINRTREEKAFLAIYGWYPNVAELKQYLDNRMGTFKVFEDMGVGVNRGAKRKQRLKLSTG